MNAVGGWVLDLLNWLLGKGVFQSEKAFVIAIEAGVAGMCLLQYFVIAALLYFSLKRIVWNFHGKDYSVNRTELLFILTPAAVGAYGGDGAHLRYRSR